MGLGNSTSCRATWTFLDLLSAFLSGIFLRWRRHRWRGHRTARPQPELQAQGMGKGVENCGREPSEFVVHNGRICRKGGINGYQVSIGISCSRKYQQEAFQLLGCVLRLTMTLFACEPAS